VQVRLARFGVRVLQPQILRGVREPAREHVATRKELVVHAEHARAPRRHGSAASSGWRGKHSSAVSLVQLITVTPAAVSGSTIVPIIVRNSA